MQAKKWKIAAAVLCLCAGVAAPCQGRTIAVDDGEPRVMAGRVDIGTDEVGPKQADLSRDGLINFKDYSILIESFGSGPADANWYILCDLYGDNRIDYNDLALLIDDWLWQAAWHK